MSSHALDDVLAALVERHLERSLERVEAALAAWRGGTEDLQAAHEAVMEHAMRAQVLSTRVARAATTGAETLLRDAVTEGLLDDTGFEALTGKKVADVEPPPSLDEEAAREAAPDEDEAAGGGRPGGRKRVVMEQLLGAGPVLVQLDARKLGVQVPPQHAGDAQLVLRFGWSLTPPIPDFDISDDGIAGTLAFGDRRFTCVIPWSAVFALVADDGRGLFWPEDAPPEARAALAADKDTRADDGTDAGGPNGSNGTAENAPAGASDEPRDPDDKPRRGHLRLV